MSSFHAEGAPSGFMQSHLWIHADLQYMVYHIGQEILSRILDVVGGASMLP